MASSSFVRQHICYYTAFDIVPTIDLSFTQLFEGENTITTLREVTFNKLTPIIEVISILGSFDSVAFRETPHSFFTGDVSVLQAVLLGYSIVMDKVEFFFAPNF